LNQVSVKVVRSSPKRFYAELSKSLLAFNRAKAGDPKWKVVALESRSKKGELQGGLYGGTLWGWLYIELLWVDEKARGRDLGSELIARAEAIGKRRNCGHSFLNTFSFQAPGFYKKQGYKPFGSLQGFPKGYERIWMVKEL
jgi:GNAT superfamily N-acetyltransferase